MEKQLKKLSRLAKKINMNNFYSVNLWDSEMTLHGRKEGNEELIVWLTYSYNCNTGHHNSMLVFEHRSRVRFVFDL